MLTLFRTACFAQPWHCLFIPYKVAQTFCENETPAHAIAHL